jgi:large subunit ribosomal protein L19e
MNLKNQRRMAARILGCGENRVWIDPNREEDVADAITRSDVRLAIGSGAIAKKPVQGQSGARRAKRRGQRAKGRRRGQGSRKGTAWARAPRKERWIRQVRPQRRLLRELRDTGRLGAADYRRFYRRSRGGMFRSVAHLEQALKAQGALKEGDQG